MERHFKRVLSVFIVIMLAVTSVAFAERGEAVEGRKLFVTYCYLCHGLGGRGDGPLAGRIKVPPRDLAGSQSVKQRSDEELLGIIDGTKYHEVAPQMPRWGKILSEKQIRAVSSYVRFLSLSPNPLIGDPESGGVIYKHYCSACHGRDGNGDGILVKTFKIRPTDHTDAARMDQITNEQMIDIITNGKGSSSLMPAWKGILKEKEIEDVVGHIRLLAH